MFDATKMPAIQKVYTAIIDLLRHKPFYGHIMQQLAKTEEVKEEKSIAVGKREGELLLKLYVNGEYVESLFEKAAKEQKSGDKILFREAWTWLGGIMEHEALHIVFDHLSMRFSDEVRGHIACELSVNSCIDRERLPDGGCHPDDYGLPMMKGAMWYYQNLKDNKKFNQQKKAGAFGAKGMLSDAIDRHKFWKAAAEDPTFQEFSKDIVRKAKDLCEQQGKDYGDIPAHLREQLEELLKPKKQIIPWQRVLRTFVASATESIIDYTLRRVSRRFGTRPGTKKEDILNLAVAVDTSGSISSEQLKTFFNEIYWIWKSGVAKVTIYEADCTVQRTYDYKGKFLGEVHGRGGTDLEPVLQQVERKFDALVYFTDFAAPKISRMYRIPTLWVLSRDWDWEDSESFPCAWGKRVKIDDGKVVAA